MSTYAIFIYDDPTSKKFVFIPWGADAVFYMGPVTADQPEGLLLRSDLARRLYGIPEIKARYLARVQELMTLVFDEADSLLGKRSEVRDAHDRYANLEVSYLLQRMERYDGLIVLATNLLGNLDSAFIRRMSAIVGRPAKAAPAVSGRGWKTKK